MASDKLGAILKQAKAGDQAAFARLLTLLDEAGAKSFAHKEILNPSHCAPRIGITGPPGAGKSTLMSVLVGELSKSFKKIGVIAVDPSSPKTQGAILGDRIRYNELQNQNDFFMRSIGTRGSLGGLSASVYLMLRAFDACEYDLVLIETVGVGQTEVDVMNAADIVALVLVPESGDSIQAMKSGLLEIADVVIVNKSDRPGADAIKHEIESELLSRDQTHVGQEAKPNDGIPKVLSATAIEKKGIAEIAAEFSKLARSVNFKNRVKPERLQSEARALSRAKLENQLSKKLKNVKSPSSLRAFLR